MLPRRNHNEICIKYELAKSNKYQGEMKELTEDTHHMFQPHLFPSQHAIHRESPIHPLHYLTNSNSLASGSKGKRQKGASSNDRPKLIFDLCSVCLMYRPMLTGGCTEFCALLERIVDPQSHTHQLGNRVAPTPGTTSTCMTCNEK